MIREVTLEMTICDGMNIAERAVKRVSDIVLSLLGILFSLPVFLYIVVRLVMQNDGPVFFLQERIGYKGESFHILKFRTMPVDAEGDGVPMLKSKSDEECSDFCRFLRDHHLDELPQLWNVLMGDMSIVGPRPERKYFIDRIMQENPDYEYIYLMRPGLTSMATLYNGYTDTMDKMLIRLQMDLEYLQKRSLWMDIKIMFTTASFIINGKKF